MWKYKTTLLVKSWWCKRETIQLFQKDLWMPLVTGVNSLHFDKPNFSIPIKEMKYNPEKKEFIIILDIEVCEYTPSDILEWFSDWTCIVDTSKDTK